MPTWYGLVDRDVWDDTEIKLLLDATPNLVITEGWCIESHFCDPGQLAPALSIPVADMRDVLEPALGGWLRYGAIWWGLQRTRQQLSMELPASDCGHPGKVPCPDETALRAALARYEAARQSADVDRIVAEVDAHRRPWRHHVQPGEQRGIPIMPGIHRAEDGQTSVQKGSANRRK